jgi:hypothetical protein
MLERYALSRVGYTPDGELTFQPKRGRERILPAKARKHTITIGKSW